MSNLVPTIQGRDFANVCAAHARRIQLLLGKFWQGDIDLWQYRKLSRELTQQFMNDLSALLNRAVG